MTKKMSTSKEFCIVLNQSNLFTNQTSEANSIVFSIFSNRVYEQGPFLDLLFCDQNNYLIEIIRRKLRKQILFNIVKDNRGGYRLPNGTWNGALGLISQNVSDLVLALYSVNEERLDLVDFPYLFADLTLQSILSSPQKYRKQNLFNILNAFTYDLWLLILITIIIIYGLNLLINKLYSMKINAKIIFDYLAILLGKCVVIRSCKLKCLIIFWSFLSIFLINCFQSDLQALEASQHPIKIENFHQLYENPDMKVLVVEKGNIKSMIMKRHKVLNKRLIDIKHEDMFSESTVLKVVKENKVFIDSYVTIGRIITHFNKYNLIQSHDHYDINLMGYPIKKTLNKKFKREFSTMIKHLHQSGIHDRKASDAVHFNKMISSFNNSNNVNGDLAKSDRKPNGEVTRFVLNVDQLSFVFICLIFGTIISIFCLTFELILRLHSLRGNQTILLVI